MAAKSPTIDANTIEREIVARLRAAKLAPGSTRWLCDS
jgi:hypothetical protein